MKEGFQNTIMNARSNHPDIDWNNFNFPPLINLFHFDLSKLQPPYKSVVRLLYISYLLIFFISIVNIINAIAQAALGYPAIIMLFTFLNFILFNSAQMYVFYRGYKGICAEYGLLKLYKIFHLLLSVLWLVLSIIGVGGFNGFTKVNEFLDEGYGGLVFLSLVESILYLISFLLGPYCVFRVHTFNGPQNDGL